MTWVNVTIPTSSEIRAQQLLDATERERAFWLKKAEALQETLENIFEHAKKHGSVDLHFRGEKLTLTVGKSSAKD